MDESVASAGALKPLTPRLPPAGWRLSPLALALAGLLQPGAVAAQTPTTTSSSGYMTSTEYVQGEVTITYSYLAFVTPQIDGVVVGPDLNWFDYYDPRSTVEGRNRFSQFMADNGPAPTPYDAGGATVDILAWGTPQLFEAHDEFIDANYETNYYTLTREDETVQLTSGDGSDASVPVGDRGECFSAGGDGPTNFGDGSGYFADCLGLDYVDLAPGTVNTNTHTTYYTTFVEEQTGNEDWQAQLFYHLMPEQSASSGTATATQAISVDEVRRLDAHAVRFRGEVGGTPSFEQTFAGQFGDESVQAQLAALTASQNGNPREDGAPVVLAWSEPELAGNDARLIGQQVSTEASTRNSTLVTTQTSTRGISEGAVLVNVGDGVDYALSPGETHTRSLTTLLTEQLTTTVTTENWLNTATYLLRPRESVTSSSGRLMLERSATDYRRIDSQATQLLGVVEGATLFDRSLPGRFTDPSVQGNLAELARPTGHALDGAPILVHWSAPRFLHSTETLLGRQADTHTSMRNSTVVTTQTSIRGENATAVMVPYGDRGTCSDSGVSGLITGEVPEGRLATCEGGTAYALSNGETNTNTHTTQLTETLTTTTTTENWQNTDTYQLTGTAVPVGLSHSAVSDVLFDDGDFAGRQRTAFGAAMNAGSGPSGISPWLMLHASEANRDANAAGAGHRRTTQGLSAGLVVPLNRGLHAGLALDHSDNDLDLDGQQETAAIMLLRLAAGMVLILPTNWQLDLSLGHGWSDIETRRGGAANGGTSRADYDADLWFSSARFGPQLTLSRSVLRPFAEINWARANLDAFTETGDGVTLIGRQDDPSRTELAAGAQFDLRWDLQSGSRVGLTAELLGGAVVEGTARERTVTFTASPDELLRASSAEENTGFARGRVGMSFGTADGFRFHVGMDGRLARDQDNWRANAGVSVSF